MEMIPVFVMLNLMLLTMVLTVFVLMDFMIMLIKFVQLALLNVKHVILLLFVKHVRVTL